MKKQITKKTKLNSKIIRKSTKKVNEPQNEFLTQLSQVMKGLEKVDKQLAKLDDYSKKIQAWIDIEDSDSNGPFDDNIEDPEEVLSPAGCGSLDEEM